MNAPRIERRDGWLLFDEPAPAFAQRRDPGALLIGSGLLAANCKLASDDSGALHLRAELPASAESPARVAAIEVAFAAAARWLAGVPLESLAAGVEACEAEAPDVAALCAEAGWPFDRREGGELAVDLGVSDAYYAAIVRARAERIHVECEIVSGVAPRGPCRDGLATLWLRANGAFRMMRAVFRRDAQSVSDSAWIEALLPLTATAEELRDALGALCVAARHGAREAQLLAGSEAFARDFLAQKRPRRGLKGKGEKGWQKHSARRSN
jgi:hypothetical protein